MATGALKLRTAPLCLLVCCFSRLILLTIVGTQDPGFTPVFTKLPPDRITAIEGETVRIDCQVVPIPQYYIYYEAWVTDVCVHRRSQISCQRNETNLEESSLNRFVVFKNGTLVISNVTTADSSNFQCRAKYANIEQLFTHISGTQLFVFARPTILPKTLNCSSTPLLYGSNMLLRCNDGRGRIGPQRDLHTMQYTWFWRLNKYEDFQQVTAVSKPQYTDLNPNLYMIVRDGLNQDLMVMNLTLSTEFRCMLKQKSPPHLYAEAFCMQQVLNQHETVPPLGSTPNPLVQPLATAGPDEKVIEGDVKCSHLDQQIVPLTSFGRQSHSCLSWLGQSYSVSSHRSLTQAQESELLALEQIEQLEQSMMKVSKLHGVGDQRVMERFACASALYTIICAKMHPPCDSEMQQSRLPICRDNCQVATAKLCLPDLTRLIEESGFNVSAVLHGRHCDGSKSVENVNYCHSLKLDRVEALIPFNFHTSDCVHSTKTSQKMELNFAVIWAQRGGGYRGSKSSTRSGARCAPWPDFSAAQSQTNWHTSKIFTCLVGAQAFCRNPLALRPEPFCFVEHPHGLIAEPCEIRICPSLESSSPSELITSAYVIGGCFALVIFIFILILTFCCRQKNRQLDMNNTSNDSLRKSGCPVPGFSSRRFRRSSALPPTNGTTEAHCSTLSVAINIDPSVAPLLQSNPLYQKSTPSSITVKGYPILDALQFDRNQMVQLDDIGVGCFGPVFLAETSQPLPGIVAWKAAMAAVADDPLLATPSTPCYVNNSTAASPTTPLATPSATPGGLSDYSPSGFQSRFELPPPPGMYENIDDGSVNGIATTRRWRFAVRMLNNNKSQDDREAFLQVAALMASLHHPCVVALLGVCAPQAPLCMLLEYCANRDLTTFLRNANPSAPPSELRQPRVAVANGHVPSGAAMAENAIEAAGEKVTRLSRVQLLAMAEQVAHGMVYLSNQGYVFRDLATRNCLVTADHRVKISDFGLCRPIPRGKPYLDLGGLVPVRWTAPEALQAPRFYVASDVWSFGVLLWEIFSWGALPYAEFEKAEDMVPRILRDETFMLERPSGPQCSAALYEVMRRCWQRSMKLRPKFNELQLRLHSLRNEEIALESAAAAALPPSTSMTTQIER